MTLRISTETTKVLSIRLPESIQESIRIAALRKGLTPSVYVRTLLYEKFSQAA